MALNANPPDLAEMRVWRPVQTPVVTIDSVIGDRVVAGMKVDTEGFELKVLRGCARALAEQRIRLIQLEWNAMSQFVAGTDRRSRFCPQKQLGWSPGSSAPRPSAGRTAATGGSYPATELQSAAPRDPKLIGPSCSARCSNWCFASLGMMRGIRPHTPRRSGCDGRRQPSCTESNYYLAVADRQHKAAGFAKGSRSAEAK
jgi:Methyltransferase FkbM domain